MIPSNFTFADWVANPSKYRKVRKAQIRNHIFTENGANDLEAGAIVSIRYERRWYNALYRREDPLFRVIGSPVCLSGENLLFFFPEV